MAKRKSAPLEGGLIARKGTAVPAQASPRPSPAAATADIPRGTEDTIAITVRLDRARYMRLKGYGVSFKPRKTNQEIIVEALDAYLSEVDDR
jgi:hypothetical protein